jgi:corrinoid protein of di/trimethylamine methyltransferase
MIHLARPIDDEDNSIVKYFSLPFGGSLAAALCEHLAARLTSLGRVELSSEVTAVDKRAILDKLRDAIVKFDFDEVKQTCNEALQEGIPAYEIVMEGMAKAMETVSQKYECGDFFLSELIMAGETMKEGMKILEPHLEAGDRSSRGKVVIGTVEGDLHDIGKNIAATLLKASGFDVIDLGADVSSGKFVRQLQDSKAQILGMSALLSTTMVKMADTVDAIVKAGIRGKVKVIIGGAAVNAEYATEIGADAAAKDAVDGVAICKSWLKVAQSH